MKKVDNLPMRAKRKQSTIHMTHDEQELPEEWTTQDAYFAQVPEKERGYIYCDHCRSTLVIRPFLYDGEFYMECQVCHFTYKNNGVIKEIFMSYSG